jgi:hypothetical protein
MKHMTIRNCPAALSEALENESKRRGQPLNLTVLELLSQALGVNIRKSNGLERFGGTWSEPEFQEFQAAVEPFSLTDPEHWE